MSNKDGTFTCGYEPCECRVADDDTHAKDDLGRVYCSEGCREGRGCSHSACNCEG